MAGKQAAGGSLVKGPSNHYLHVGITKTRCSWGPPRAAAKYIDLDARKKKSGLNIFLGNVQVILGNGGAEGVKWPRRPST